MSTRIQAVLILAIFPALWTAFPWPQASAAGKPLVIIIAPATGVTDIGLATLRRAFEGQTAEVNGKRLIPVNHPGGSALRDQFDQAVLGLKPTEVGAFWVDRRVRGEGAPPKTVPAVQLAVRLVASVPGIITYCTQDQVIPTVRVVTIDGKSQDQAGYALNN